MATKSKTQPILINRCTGFGIFAFKATYVDGNGINKPQFEADYPVVARFAYSKTVPGVIVMHALNEKLEGPWSTFLQVMKFYHPRWQPRKATAVAVRNLIVSELAQWRVEKTQDEIDADVAHLLAEPSEDEVQATYRNMMEEAA